jgi:hypothetical protein
VRLGVIAIFTSGLVAAGLTLAETPVYEGFADYPVGTDLIGQDGGTGFSSPWNSRLVLLNSGPSAPIGVAAVIHESSLFYQDGTHQLIVTGGSLVLDGSGGSAQIARAIDPDALPHPGPDPKTGKTTYLSFLGERRGEAADPDDPVYGGNYPYGDNLYPRAAGTNLFGDDNGDAIQLLVGNPSNEPDDFWRLRGQDLDGRSKDPRSDQPFGQGSGADLVVIRIDHGGGADGADRLFMYVNPVLSSEAANTDRVVADWETRDDPLYMQPRWLGLEAGNGDEFRPAAVYAFDEFRIGSSWEDVTPHIPVETWAGYPLQAGNTVFLEESLGWLQVDPDSNWVYSYSMGGWIFLTEDQAVMPDGFWLYAPRYTDGQ